jgi:hypothetical protein
VTRAIDAPPVTDTHPLPFYTAGSRRFGRRTARMVNAAERQAAIIDDSKSVVI